MKMPFYMDNKNDIARVLAPVLYILSRTGPIGKHKLFKILYFADKEHIATYGRTFTGDQYIAMLNGPVPSNIYDYIKIVEGKSKIPVEQDFVDELTSYIQSVNTHDILSLKEADEQFLSRSTLKFLQKSIDQNGNKSFKALTTKSHDSAWKAAQQNTEMSTIEIAKDAGANEEMLKYIQETK